MYDKSISDSMEAFVAACFLNMKAWRVARLLYCLGLSIEPHPQRLISVGAKCTSWVPLLLSAPFRAIDPAFAPEQAAAVALRRKKTNNTFKTNAPLAMEVHSMEIDQELDYKRLSLQPLQVALGYRFRRVNILLQALNHPTSSLAFKWGCYQR